VYRTASDLRVYKRMSRPSAGYLSTETDPHATSLDASRLDAWARNIRRYAIPDCPASNFLVPTITLAYHPFDIWGGVISIYFSISFPASRPGVILV